MLSASSTNSEIHSGYEELGHYIKMKIESGDLKIEDTKVDDMIEMIKLKEQELEEIEKEVRKIKISTGVKDISKDDQ